MKDIKTIEDFKEAITSNNESYFFFYSNGCESCREIKPQVKLFESKAQPQAAFYNISTYGKNDLVEALKINWIPYLIHSRNGKVVKIDGADEILDYINERPF